MNRQFVVVSEARADFTIATDLADRILLNEIDWMEPGLLDSQREWVGEDRPGCQLVWSSIAHNAISVGIRARGFFSDEPGLPDAQAARRAILYVLWQFGDVDAIFLIRDTDKELERRKGLEQARAADTSGTAIIIGVARHKRECWAISGFVPENDAENELLAKEIHKIGKNPCLHSDELTPCSDHEPGSPKRILKVLTDDDWEREARCWRTTDLSVLKERGKDNGLADYLDEITNHVVPLLSGYKRKEEKQ